MCVCYDKLARIPVAVTYKAEVCDRSFFGIAGSKHAEVIRCSSYAFVMHCVDNGLWEKLIIRSEESYRPCGPNCV